MVDGAGDGWAAGTGAIGAAAAGVTDAALKISASSSVLVCGANVSRLGTCCV